MQKKKPTLEDIERADALMKDVKGIKLRRVRNTFLREIFKPYPIDEFLREQAKRRRKERKKRK